MLGGHPGSAGVEVATMGTRVTTLIAIVAVGVLGPPLAADVAQAQQFARIGILSAATSDKSAVPYVEALRQGLRELGWAEGQNFALEQRHASGRLEVVADLTVELVRLNVNVIITAGTETTRIVNKVTRGAVPIVMAPAAEPVSEGLVASLGRPGGNITGLSLMNYDLSQKRVELLKEVIPKLSRTAFLFNPLFPFNARDLQATQAGAGVLGVVVRSFEARTPADLEQAFSAMSRQRTDAVITSLDVFSFFHAGMIVEFAALNRLPAMYSAREFVVVGGLMAYGPSLLEVWRRAAGYVDKILQGANPADLPVQQPTKFELVLNLKTAKTLGLTIPQSVLLRADEVIQ